jgi:hypothetical protein
MSWLKLVPSDCPELKGTLYYPDDGKTHGGSFTKNVGKRFEKLAETRNTEYRELFQELITVTSSNNRVKEGLQHILRMSNGKPKNDQAVIKHIVEAANHKLPLLIPNISARFLEKYTFKSQFYSNSHYSIDRQPKNMISGKLFEDDFRSLVVPMGIKTKLHISPIYLSGITADERVQHIKDIHANLYQGGKLIIVDFNLRSSQDLHAIQSRVYLYECMKMLYGIDEPQSHYQSIDEVKELLGDFNIDSAGASGCLFIIAATKK